MYSSQATYLCCKKSKPAFDELICLMNLAVTIIPVLHFKGLKFIILNKKKQFTQYTTKKKNRVHGLTNELQLLKHIN